MATQIGQFNTFATNDPGILRTGVDAQGQLADVGPTGCFGRLVAPLVDLYHWFRPDEAMVAQNQAAVEAFQTALTDYYGAAASQATPEAQGGGALSARRILTGQEHAEQLNAAKLQDYQAFLAAPADARLRATALNRMMADVVLPPGPHAAYLDAPLRAALDPLMDACLRLDGSPGSTVLANLGSQLAVRLEEHMLRAFDGYTATPADRRPLGNSTLGNRQLDELMGGFDPDAGLAALAAALPGLQGRLHTETANFTSSMQTLLTRVAGDMGALGGRFFGNVPLQSLTGVHLTDSDPHKQGNRVAILNFGEGRQVVYKPRDVRIDEAITGADLPQGRRSLMEMAGADITFRFLAGEDETHYGYVEFLHTDSVDDRLMSPEQGAAYYHELGRGTAALMLAGATDIHHENVMVSGRKPYFTDLEFAFSSSVMGNLAGLLTDPPPRARDGLLGEAVSDMDLGMLFSNALDTNSLHPQFRVQGNAFTEVPPWHDVFESVIVVREEDGTLVDNRRMREDERPSLNARYAQDFRDGMLAGLQSLQIAERQHHRYADFLADTQGFQIRYHPLSTEDQRAELQNRLELSYRQPNPQGADDVMAGRPPSDNAPLRALLDQKGLPTPERTVALQDAMVQAYGHHDVPYFSRQAGGLQALFDGHQPLTWQDPVTGQDHDDFFLQPANVGGVALSAALTQARAHVLEEIADLAGIWVGAQLPAQGGQLGHADYMGPSKTLAFLARLADT